MIKSFQDLEVYKLSYLVAMDIFHLSRKFPKEEMYSLTSQIIRSSRSISANIVEGWISPEEFLKYDDQLDHIGKMLNKLHQNWETKKQ